MLQVALLWFPKTQRLVLRSAVTSVFRMKAHLSSYHKCWVFIEMKPGTALKCKLLLGVSSMTNFWLD